MTKKQQQLRSRRHGNMSRAPFVRAGGLKRFLAGIRSDTNDERSPGISQNPTCYVTRIPLQIKNEVGKLESPVIDRVFGMALAISPA
jgi:hypothetical protein